MAYVITNNRHYINIANAIRNTSFGNIEGPLAPDEFAQRIEEISAIANEEGRSAGYTDGLEAGKQAEYDRFWEGVMESSSFIYRFAGRSWNDITFKPNKDIKPIGDAYNMFYTSDICNLSGILSERGLTLDLSECTGRVDQMFSYAYNMTVIPYLDLRNVTTTYSNTFNGMFNGCTSLHTIEGMHLREDGSQVFNSTFRSCTALENLTIYGVIGQNGLNLSSASKLTHDSLMSVINALKDYSSDTSGTAWAVTLGTANLAKLTDDEKAIATQKGWTLA